MKSAHNSLRLFVVMVPFALWACNPANPAPPAATVDAITLQSNDADDEAIVLFDGEQDGVCENDLVLRGQTNIDLGNATSSLTCDSELMVFSDDDAAVLVPSPGWSGSLGDVEVVDLAADEYAVPLTIWIVSSDPATQTAFRTRALADVARALQLYNDMNSGIGFEFDQGTDLHAISDDAQVTTVEDTIADVFSSGQCSTAPIRSDSALNYAGRLNVYYSGATGWNGVECDNGQVIYIAPTANNETLTHEIGHGLDLRHYDAANDNLMWYTGIAGRNNFTIGQIFRMNLNPSSALNVFGPRTGTMRNCGHATISRSCPDVTLDTSPK